MEPPSPPAPGSKRDRLVSALLLFLPLALWPAAGAVAAWRVGETGAFELALAGVAVAALPSVFTLLGLSWSRKVAEAFALGGMVLGILYVLRHGFNLLAVPAVGYVVVYAYLSHDRFRSSGASPLPKASPPPPEEHPLAWLKENVEAIAVAFIMALVIRCFCVEVFKIPSSSMEPTLLGDNAADGRSGDRIIVSKLTYALQAVRRFEPVVFKFPLNPMKNYIKRVVGLPREELVIYRGNVFTRPDGAGDGAFRIQRKPLNIQRSVWVDAWRRGQPLLQSRETFDEYFHVGPSPGTWTLRNGILSGGGKGAQPGWTAEPINDGSSATVNDVLFDAQMSLSRDEGSFWVELRHDFGVFTLTLSPTGKSTLVLDKIVHQLATPAFPAGTPVRVEFMVTDGRAIVLFDGRVQSEVVFQETLDQGDLMPLRHGLSFGSRDLRFELSALRVGRDIHYLQKFGGPDMTRGKPLVIGDDEYFMLGDNVNNSHDGRAWKKYTVVLKDGRVIEYEGQSLIDKQEVRERWARRHNCPEPNHYVEADIHGHEQAWRDVDVKSRDERPYNLVKGRFIIGRAFAVCWPLDRCLKLIR